MSCSIRVLLFQLCSCPVSMPCYSSCVPVLSQFHVVLVVFLSLFKSKLFLLCSCPFSITSLSNLCVHCWLQDTEGLRAQERDIYIFQRFMPSLDSALRKGVALSFRPTSSKVSIKLFRPQIGRLTFMSLTLKKFVLFIWL